jgi:hypothetical protein
MKNKSFVGVIISTVFILGGCAPTSSHLNMPKEMPITKRERPVTNELIDGRYFCYPGCNGHLKPTSFCSTAELEKELTRRSIELSMVQESPAIP